MDFTVLEPTHNGVENVSKGPKTEPCDIIGKRRGPVDSHPISAVEIWSSFSLFLSFLIIVLLCLVLMVCSLLKGLMWCHILNIHSQYPHHPP